MLGLNKNIDTNGLSTVASILMASGLFSVHLPHPTLTKKSRDMSQ